MKKPANSWITTLPTCRKKRVCLERLVLYYYNPHALLKLIGLGDGLNWTTDQAASTIIYSISWTANESYNYIVTCYFHGRFYCWSKRILWTLQNLRDNIFGSVDIFFKWCSLFPLLWHPILLSNRDEKKLTPFVVNERQPLLIQ